MLAKNTTFGVEIECYIPEKHRGLFPLGSYHKGQQVPGYPTGWNTQKDGSLNNEVILDGERYFGAEIVSPVLKGTKGLVEVWAVISDLADLGCVVKPECGLHIHVGAKNLLESGKVGQLVTEFRQFEKVFFALNGDLTSTRYNNHYCKKSSMWTSPETDRHQSLNLKNLDGNKKTVEFRLFAGTMNPEIITTAIYMTVSMVSKVSQGLVSQNGKPSLLESAKQFVAEYWLDSNRLVESESPDDLIEVLLNQVQLATPFLGA